MFVKFIHNISYHSVKFGDICTAHGSFEHSISGKVQGREFHESSI